MSALLTPASIEADCATLVESLSTLVRCARVNSTAAKGAGGREDENKPSSIIAPALVPAVAERLIASASSLAGAAAELRRRAALADVSRRVAAVRASRKKLSSAAEGVQRELDAIADEIAEAVTALDLHLASSAHLPAPRDSPLAYKAAGEGRGGGEGKGTRDNDDDDDEEEERLALDALCASLGGYFR